MRVSSIISSQRFCWGSEILCLDIQFWLQPSRLTSHNAPYVGYTDTAAYKTYCTSDACSPSPQNHLPAACYHRWHCKWSQSHYMRVIHGQGFGWRAMETRSANSWILPYTRYYTGDKRQQQKVTFSPGVSPALISGRTVFPCVSKIGFCVPREISQRFSRAVRKSSPGTFTYCFRL